MRPSRLALAAVAGAAIVVLALLVVPPARTYLEERSAANTLEAYVHRLAAGDAAEVCELLSLPAEPTIKDRERRDRWCASLRESERRLTDEHRRVYAQAKAIDIHVVANGRLAYGRIDLGPCGSQAEMSQLRKDPGSGEWRIFAVGVFGFRPTDGCPLGRRGR